MNQACQMFDPQLFPGFDLTIFPTHAEFSVFGIWWTKADKFARLFDWFS